MSIPELPTLCSTCMRFRNGETTPEIEPDMGGDTDTAELTCDAFPGGIPSEIAEDGFDHRQPFPGDHGMRYQKATA